MIAQVDKEQVPVVALAVNPSRKAHRLPDIAEAKRGVTINTSRRLTQSAVKKVTRDVRHMLRLDDNIEQFYSLVADDNDSNLGNGTPHFAQIRDAFNAHGIGTGYFVGFVHTPLADQPGVSGYPVTATITYTGPVGTLDAGSATLHYSLNSDPYVTATMTSTRHTHTVSANDLGRSNSGDGRVPVMESPEAAWCRPSRGSAFLFAVAGRHV